MILDDDMKMNIALGLSLIILILVIILIFRKPSTKQGYAYVANNLKDKKDVDVRRYSYNQPWQSLWKLTQKCGDPESCVPQILDPKYNGCKPRNVKWAKKLGDGLVGGDPATWTPKYLSKDGLVGGDPATWSPFPLSKDGTL